jgi:hypothetical protein
LQLTAPKGNTAANTLAQDCQLPDLDDSDLHILGKLS